MAGIATTSRLTSAAVEAISKTGFIEPSNPYGDLYGFNGMAQESKHRLLAAQNPAQRRMAAGLNEDVIDGNLRYFYEKESKGENVTNQKALVYAYALGNSAHSEHDTTDSIRVAYGQMLKIAK